MKSSTSMLHTCSTALGKPIYSKSHATEATIASVSASVTDKVDKANRAYVISYVYYVIKEKSSELIKK